MAFDASRVTVTTSATSIAAPLTTPNAVGGSINVRKTAVLVRVPTGGQSVFVGPSGVTTGTGFEVVAGASVEFILESDDTLFGIVAATTQVVHVLRSVADHGA